MTTVIEHGTLTAHKHHGCTCLACYDAANAYENRRRRHKAYGTWQPLVDAGPARDHLEQLHAQGMTWQQIADQAGLHVEYLRQLRLDMGGQRRIERIRPERAQMLLALRLVLAPAGPKSTVPALGTARRLQALRANGWPSLVLAQRAGVTTHTVGAAVTGERGLVFAATAERVVELYEDINGLDPRRYGVTPLVADRTIRRAERLGWASPRCWDGIDMDDPAAVPGHRGRRRYAITRNGDQRRQDIVEDTAELIAQGMTREVISARLGIGWDNIRAAHTRCGVPMPELTS